MGYVKAPAKFVTRSERHLFPLVSVRNIGKLKEHVQICFPYVVFYFAPVHGFPHFS